MSSTFVALAQPAVGMAFPPSLAGRALSAYNLVIFAGVFVVQWGIGLLDRWLPGRGAGTAWRIVPGGDGGVSGLHHAVLCLLRMAREG